MRFSTSALALLVCAAPAAAQPVFPTFTEVLGTVNPLGALPVEAVGVPTFADLTGDGVPDLVYDPAEVTDFPSEPRTGGLAVLFGGGRAGAAPQRRGDGPDLLFFAGVRGADGRVGFVPAAQNPFGALATGEAGEQVDSPALADLDGDGDLDLLAIATSDASARFVYFENVGTAQTPSFAFRPDAAVPPVAAIGFPTLADLDGDGDADLVTAAPAEDGAQIRYFVNTGTAQSPAFSEGASPFGAATFPLLSFAPAFGDFDGDGDLDAAVGGVDFGDESFASVRLYENVGTPGAPAFALASDQPFGDLGGDPFLDEDTAAPAAADLDGDGDVDLAVVLGIGPFPRSVYFENLGDSAFAQADELQNPIRLTVLTPELGTANEPYRPAEAADLDGDGDLDLVIGGTGDFGPLRYVENIGTAAMPAFALREGGQNPFSSFVLEDFASPTLADLDGDGDLDLLVAAALGDGVETGQFDYFENVGSAAAPSFVRRTGSASPFANLSNAASPIVADLADLDGDGDFDLVFSTINPNTFAGALRYAENTGTATAPTFTLLPSGTGPLPVTDGLALLGPSLADLDGDGDLDLVLAQASVASETGSGPVRVFQNEGTATAPIFVERTGAPGLFGGPVPLPSRVALGDFDGDGDVDAFSATGTTWVIDGEEGLSGSAIRLFLNNGDARVDAAEPVVAQTGLVLGAPYPNPLTGSAEFTLALGAAQHVRAEVFDALGRRVAVLHDGALAAGADHALRFDAAGLPAGLYVVRVQSAGASAVRRVTKL